MLTLLGTIVYFSALPFLITLSLYHFSMRTRERISKFSPRVPAIVKEPRRFNPLRVWCRRATSALLPRAGRSGKSFFLGKKLYHIYSVRDVVQRIHDGSDGPPPDLVYANLSRLLHPIVISFAYGALALVLPYPATHFAVFMSSKYQTSLSELTKGLVIVALCGGALGVTFFFGTTSSINKKPTILAMRNLANRSRSVSNRSLMRTIVNLAVIDNLRMYWLVGGYSVALYLVILDPTGKMVSEVDAESSHLIPGFWIAILGVLLAVASSLLARRRILRLSGTLLCLRALLLYGCGIDQRAGTESGFLAPTPDPIGGNRAALAELADTLEMYSTWIPQTASREVVTNPIALLTRAAARDVRRFVRGRESLDRDGTNAVHQQLQEVSIVLSGPFDMATVGRTADRLRAFNEDGSPSEELLVRPPGRVGILIQRSSANLEVVERPINFFKGLWPVAPFLLAVIIGMRGNWEKLIDLILG